MLRHMPRVGNLGLDMMLRTCTIQVNLDYSSEADMVKKFRVGLALAAGRDGLVRQFAVHRRQAQRLQELPQPYLGRHRSGADRHAAVRVRRWLRLRALLRLCARRADVFRVPRRPYIDAAGQSFRDFLDGKLPALPGEKPTMADWTDHLSTAFPEVRLKSFLEMRGADGGRWGRICALPALWVGLSIRRRARCGLGPGQALDHRGARGASPCRPATSARRAGSGRRHGPRPGQEALEIAAAGLTERAEINPPATMKAASSIRCATWSPAARPSPTGCSTAIMANGRAMSATSMKSSASDLLWRIQRNGCEKFT